MIELLPDIQQFLGLLNDSQFQETARFMKGYDISTTGQMVFPPR